MSELKSVLSCIQPTGDIHIGNYFGAVKNWLQLQEKYKCFYGVVDYHAMTMPYDVKKLRTNTWDLMITLIAAGVKVENLFIQSLVPEHAELGWILNCFCSYGQLTRMTQFKDKSTQVNQGGKEQFISAGLLDYPVLQTADILIYKADYVPVGKDQDQHIELTRDIANRFNFQANKDYFVMPETLHTETPKILSTADPMRKMSKSAGEKHYISLLADEATIRKQIKSAVTDTGDTPEGEMSAGLANLFSMLKACDKIDLHQSLMNDHLNGTLRYVDLKDAVADALVELTTPFREKKEALKAEKKNLRFQIKESSEQIRKIAQETVREVKELTGLLNVRF